MEGLFYLVTVFFGYGLRGPFQFSPTGQKKSPLGFQAGSEEGALGLIDS